MIRLEVGAPTIRLPNGNIISDTFVPSLSNPDLGWYFIRVAQRVETSLVEKLKTSGLFFLPRFLVAPGWFRMFLHPEQVVALMNEKAFHLQPVKRCVAPLFDKLKNKPKLIVVAAREWNPDCKKFKIRMVEDFTESYIVEGVAATELYTNPYVVDVMEAPLTELD